MKYIETNKVVMEHLINGNYKVQIEYSPNSYFRKMKITIPTSTKFLNFGKIVLSVYIDIDGDSTQLSRLGSPNINYNNLFYTHDIMMIELFNPENQEYVWEILENEFKKIQNGDDIKSRVLDTKMAASLK